PKMKDKFDLYVGRKIPEQNTQERINKTLTEMASKFCFTSSRCELPYQLTLLISLRSGIKSQSIVETIFLTFYGSIYARILSAGASQKMERSFTFRQLHFLQGYV
ncbi:MAG: hypothetical protein MR662_03485, partial [Treponema porcinum]|uniref:hypothetical protein n=1 Tax=Treponema porcinum TaxID=261392 RepID=UPI0023546B68